MSTSRTIIFALLSFLAGVNACLQCAASLDVDGSAVALSKTFLNDGVRYCIYGSSANCQYDAKDGLFVEGDDACPRTRYC
ncbi:uncharacterized protein EDB91DRAFT_1147170 [Suillus paluster]|uniref:uncharacterized protein n=1 Tax=Suillus paluster TaxID=48578 RepID=UPI001B8811CF|nr:uncharacterized protein EDB91DRAFT_1147170 [Suillus paluster]KAG1734270.1 hypothetical protein EDB91DRAFT_1147170 [Suillus paluster]